MRFGWMRVSSVLAAALCAVPSSGWASEPASTAFTYQGRLVHQGMPVSGAHEFEFRLYDAQTDGNLVASLPAPTNIDVEDGLFETRLDFGPQAINGLQLFLEVAVRPYDSSAPFTVLEPRQELTAAPYASVALNSPFLRDGSGLYYSGRLALGSDVPPTGMLDVVGPPHDSAVVFPQNAISSLECGDEPGTASAFDEDSIWINEPVTLASSTIVCPGPGYVLAVGTATLQSVGYNAAGASVAIQDTVSPSDVPPSDAYHFRISTSVPGTSLTAPVPVQKVFPVTGGTKTFHLRAWSGWGDNHATSQEAGLTLVFLPTAYGPLPAAN